MHMLTSARRLRRRALLSMAISIAVASSAITAEPASLASPGAMDAGATQIADVVTADYRLSGVIGEERTKTLTITYPESSFLRLHFSAIDVPAGAHVVVANGDGSELHRFSREDALANGDAEGYYAMSLGGDTAHVSIEGGSAGSAFGIRVDQVDVGFGNAFMPEAIIGGDQRQRAACFKSSDPQAYARSRALARVYGNGYVATAWRVSAENRMLTNHHVINNQQDPRSFEMWFGYEHNQCTGNDATAPGVKVRGGTRLEGDAGLDFQLFTLDDAAFRAGKVSEFGYLGLDASPLRSGTAIYIPQHGAGQPRQIATVADGGAYCSIAGKSGTMGRYNCDTVGGSSGSPVVDRSSHRVRVLHNSAAGSYNQGHAIEHIWPRISRHFAGGQVPGGN